MATIKEVAQRAGVSVTTVSRVLNKRGYISQEMHDKIPLLFLGYLHHRECVFGCGNRFICGCFDYKTAGAFCR